jgi:membrane protease YdiL (CAAX protease family)
MTETTAISPRIDPAHDTRRLVLYFAGLIGVYVGVLAIARPEWGGGENELGSIAIGIMFAPTVGAIVASVFGPGIIRFGRPTWWIAAGFVPPLVVLAVTWVAAGIGMVDVEPGELGPVLLLMVPLSIVSCVSAIGEEIGWRGFLWPLLRRRTTFLVSSAIMWAIWFAYHAPMTIGGLYGTVGGLPAFGVGILGFVLFVGVLTERSRSIWPSVIAHGAWNASVATRFSTGETADPMFTGSDALLGEFGWIAAVTMLAVGTAAAAWHVRTPTKDGLSPREPMGYDSAVQSLAFRTEPRAAAR